MGEGARPVLVFRVADKWFGLDVGAVESVERMVEIAPLPRSPEAVGGVIDVGGEIYSVFSIRRRFGLPDREGEERDFLILARTARRRVALPAEEIGEVRDAGSEWLDVDSIGASVEPVAGIVKSPEGLIFVHDLDRFLSPADESLLEEALRDEREYITPKG